MIFSPRPAASGLSPHSRGKHARRGSWRVSTGSIPAFTGETPAAPQGSPVTEVYPRIHGGNPVQAGKFQQAGGLSPHSRGKRDCRCGEPDSGGSIPAFTGETLVTVTMAWRKGVYPRIHGGNGPVWFQAVVALGLSPHSRGKHNVCTQEKLPIGSIPAFTGETESECGFRLNSEVYPRIHGGNCCGCWRVSRCQGLSPHSRGKQSARSRSPLLVGSIPAFTGETCPLGNGAPWA